MKIKNISKGNFNLESGTLKPGSTGDATLIECKLLFSSKKAEEVKAKPKPIVKPKAKANG